MTEDDKTIQDLRVALDIAHKENTMLRHKIKLLELTIADAERRIEEVRRSADDFRSN